MTSRDVVLTEVGAAFALLGLLLVFLPLFLQAFERALAEQTAYQAVRAIGFRAYFVVGAIALAATVVTLGLLAVWLECEPLAVLTGAGLLALTWCVVLLAALAVWTR